MLKNIFTRFIFFFLDGDITEGKLSINLVNLSIAAAFFAAGFIVGKV